jgi:hypothetical protein
LKPYKYPLKIKVVEQKEKGKRKGVKEMRKRLIKEL